MYIPDESFSYFTPLNCFFIFGILEIDVIALIKIWLLSKVELSRPYLGDKRS